MEFLYVLEKCRLPILNEFMLLITKLGEETTFLVVALMLFWCIDKRKGYFILSVGFVGTMLNQFMKLMFRIPRPWVLDSNFTILEQAREAATGYSFPSGHTQSAVGTFGAIAYTSKNRLVRTIMLLIAVLVPFSRMYIGVHTPLDVTVAAAMAVAIIFLLRLVVYGNDGKCFPILLAVMSVISMLYLLFVLYFPFPEAIDSINLASGTKNAFTMIGAILGLNVVYIIDEKWLHFSVKAVWWVQIIKVLIGLMLVLAVKSGLSTPLATLFGESIGRAVRYFLVVIVAGTLWPLSFKWLAKIGRKV